MRQAKTDLAEQIFSATDRLMAKEGLNQLSMHKLAKEANVAAGTIYLYFKNKDETKPFFEQYRQMWKNIWYFLQENPTILSNLKQYESLPNFKDICKNVKNCRWDLFCHQAQKAGLLAELSEDILFLLSLKTAINLASDAKFIDFDLKPEILESVIERSWRAIQK